MEKAPDVKLQSQALQNTIVNPWIRPCRKPAKEEEFLDSLANGLQLLRIYATGVASVTVQEAAEQLDVTRAASRRILLTLEKLGYVRQDGRQFSPTPKVMDLGYAYFASLSLPRLVRPVMQDVARALGETCSLGVLDREHVVFLAREEAPAAQAGPDDRQPPAAYAHSLGRALLSTLDDGRLTGIWRTPNSSASRPTPRSRRRRCAS